MGFFSSKPISAIFEDGLYKIIASYEIDNPDDAIMFKLNFGLAVVLVGLINRLAVGSNKQDVLNEVVITAHEASKPLSFKIKDVAENDIDEILILGALPKDQKKNSNTIITGDIAFQALFDKKGHKLIQEVLNNGGGMMGPAGAAAIVLGDIVFNEDNPTGFMFVSGHLLKMCDEILNS